MAKNTRNLERAIQEFRWSYIITALAFLVLGVVMVIKPSLAMNALCYLVGAVLTVYGVFNIFSFLFARERTVTFELIVGVLTTAIGIFTLISPSSIMNILQLVLGLVIIIDSLLGLKRAFALRELESKGWKTMLILSVAAAVLGILFMVKKDLFGTVLFTIIGIVLTCQGISDLISVIQISIIGRRVRKELDLVEIRDPELD